ncbi:MAG: response regulator [Gammaproteobacteria bacterium]|nr:response regulator [Gammaproteobacteria bacterium]
MRFLGILLLLAVSLGVLFLLERQAIYEQVRSDVAKSIVLEKESLSRRTNDWKNGLMGLSRVDAIRRLVTAIDDNQSTLASRRALEQTFTEFLNNQENQIYSLRLIDRFGKELVVVREMQVQDDFIDLSSDPEFRRIMAYRPFQILPGVSQFDEAKRLTLNINIASSGIVIGVLIMEINTQDLLTYLGRQLNDNFHSIYFVNDKREVVIEKQLGGAGANVEQPELIRVLEIFDDQDMENTVVNNSGSLWGTFKDNSLNVQVLVAFEVGRVNALIQQQFLFKGVLVGLTAFLLAMLLKGRRRESHDVAATPEPEKGLSLPKITPKKTSSNTINARELATISNEIRIPVNSILGMLSLLRESKVSSRQIEYIELAYRSGEWGLELLNELVDYSRFKANELKLDNIDFDLRGTIKDVVEMLSIEAYKKGLELTSLISSQVPERVTGDPTRLRQVLINLTSQAIKFTDHGDIVLSASLARAEKEQIQLRFEINDSGRGLDTELQKAFVEEPDSSFVVADEKYNTTSLGMNLSKKIVSLMQGKIGADENGNGGMTFWFEIPYVLAHTHAAQIPSSSLDGHQVFLVGEVEGNRKTISSVLEKWGMVCDSTGDFAKASTLLSQMISAKGPVGFCIIDISLSSSANKAFDLVRALTANEDTASVNIIVLTAKGSPGDGQTARELGVKAYLSKPISRSQLQDSLMQIAGGMEALDQATMVTKHSLREAKPAGHTVLIVESNFTNQKILAGFLSRMGVYGDIATNSEAALDALKKRPYELVIMDMQTTDKKALQTTKLIREYEYSLALGDDQSLERAIRTPVIAMSTSFQDDEREECLRVGMDGFLKKPVNMKSMEELLAKWGIIEAGINHS